MVLMFSQLNGRPAILGLMRVPPIAMRVIVIVIVIVIMVMVMVMIMIVVVRVIMIMIVIVVMILPPAATQPHRHQANTNDLNRFFHELQGV